MARTGANLPARLKALAPALAVGVVLLGILAAVLVSPGMHPAPPVKAVAKSIALPKKIVVHAKPAPKPRPPKPSAFQLENAMTLRQRMERWTPFIKEASRRFDISGQWIRAVIMIESGGRTMLAEEEPITSRVGAMGLMQLMPETWREMRAAYRLGDNPYDPHDNIIAGSAVLAILYRQYGYPTMFAAYNDGPGMLAAHAALGESLPIETENYVRSIASILSTGVLPRNGGRRSLARLTRPDGSAVVIDAGAVVSIRDALPGEYADTVQSVIAIGRMRQGVRESKAAATAEIRAHGGLI
jgi:hypothetical protein